MEGTRHNYTSMFSFRRTSPFRGCQVTRKCSKRILKLFTDAKFRQRGAFFPHPRAEEDDEYTVEAALPLPVCKR